jgi:hypothetical protein
MTIEDVKREPTDDEVELKPCPFCGSANVDPEGWASLVSSGPACDDCGAGSPHTIRSTLEENTAAWNDRAAILAMDRRAEATATFGDAGPIPGVDFGDEFAPYASPPTPAVAVKPLEWGPYPNPVFNDPANVAVANIEFKHVYQVQRDPWGPGYIAYLAPKHGTLWWESKGHETLDAAKAAAQADYEQRIRSALVGPMPAVAVPEDFLDALEDAAAGMRYVRQTYGDLAGVGFDRVQEKYLGVVRKLAAAPEPPATDGDDMSEWQPIETAPKDGRSFMVYVAKDDLAGPHCFAPVSRTSNGMWWDDSTGDRIEPIRGATHWMPLPAPPAVAREET